MRISITLLLYSLSGFFLFFGSAFSPVSAAPFIQPFPSANLFIFEGNLALSQQLLMQSASEELKAFALDKENRAAIDDAAFQMELAYRMAGFPEARVDYVWNTSALNETVRFLVFEGKMTEIREIGVSGNSFFPIETFFPANKHLKDNVEKKMLFPYVKSEIDTICEDILALYRKDGFLDTVVSIKSVSTEHEERKYLDISLVILEGPRYQITSLSFQNEPLVDVAETINTLSAKFVGSPFYPRKKLQIRSEIEELYQKNGYFDVSVTVRDDKNRETGAVDLLIAIESGTQAVIGDIFIRGNERTKEDFIRKRLHFVPGETYTLDAKKASFQSLYQTGLFSKIQLQLEEETGDSRSVFVDLTEKSVREIYFEPGWGSYELLRLAAGFRDRNLFGSGRIFQASSVISTKGRSVSTGITDRWFLGSQIIADIPLHYYYREEPFFTLENSGAALYFSRKFKNKAYATLGYLYESKVISDVDPDNTQLMVEDNYTTGSLSLQISRDTRNDLFFPTMGYRGFFSAKVAKPFLGGDFSFYKFSTGLRYFKEFVDSFVLGLRYTTGIIIPGSDQFGIPLGERYFNGGENSVRSFRESRLGPVDASGDHIGGAAFNTINIEFRKKITDVFWGTFFVDFGNISPGTELEDGTALLSSDRSTLVNATLDDYFQNMKSAVGIGIQYLLPVGPARLDFAYNPSGGNDPGEEEYAVHFSIGMAF